MEAEVGELTGLPKGERDPELTHSIARVAPEPAMCSRDNCANPLKGELHFDTGQVGRHNRSPAC